MDVTPMHGKPGHPQTQGKDERFHRTLKEDLLLRKPLTDLAEAQKEFDEFRDCYNHERPHGALELDVPAKHYRPSRRKVVENPTEPEYDSGKNLRKVNCCGYVSVYKKRYYLSESFIGKYIELRAVGGRFARPRLRKFRNRQNRFRGQKVRFEKNLQNPECVNNPPGQPVNNLGLDKSRPPLRDLCGLLRKAARFLFSDLSAGWFRGILY